jgi:5-methylcytosine-specific restriction endonuclease McrA
MTNLDYSRRALTSRSLSRQPKIPTHVRKRIEGRATRLRELGYQRYGDYLKSPHWLRLRNAYRESGLPQTCVCGDEEVHLHHLTYDRIGAERLDDLTPLCRRCHALVHVLEWRGDIGLDLDGLCDPERALAGRAWLAAEIEAREEEAAQRKAEERAYILSLSFAARMLRVKHVGQVRKLRTHKGDWIALKGMIKGGVASNEVLTRRLRKIEAIVYDWDDWS